MDDFWKLTIWRQFGAAIEMLENAIRDCPDELWSSAPVTRQEAGTDQAQFWYLAYHALFWLDYYSSDSREGFVPPPPFTLSELDPEGSVPERAYSKAELLAYLEHGRAKCRAAISGLSDRHTHDPCGVDWLDISRAELLLYNMRHVQHHAAQSNLVLRHASKSAPRWVAKAARSLYTE